jgi:DNA end-binding protein Ku
MAVRAHDAEPRTSARALWKGAISFGLVNIPVEIHSAEDRKAFQFAMLDKRDFSPVGYKRYSKKSGKEVDWDDVVKGYEYEKGQYVVLSDEDFKRANVKATQTIDIKAFVDANAISPEYYETPYFLSPSGRGSPKVYALLRETLRATGRAAIAQVVIRTTNHLAAITVGDDALVLITLRYADELRTTDGLDLPAGTAKGAGVSPKEIELAKRLVDDMTTEWKPADYKDTYHRDLVARIREKIRRRQTHEITAPEKETSGKTQSAEVVDLMALLKRSLDAAPARRVAGRRPSGGRTGKADLRIVAGGQGAAKPAVRRKRA